MDRPPNAVPMNWETLQDIIQTSSGEQGQGRLAELGRSAAQHTGYMQDMQVLRATWASVGDYVLVSKFGLPHELEEGTGRRRAVRSAGTAPAPAPAAEEAAATLRDTPPAFPAVVLALNEYPYYLSGGILHFVLWKRTVGSRPAVATAGPNATDMATTAGQGISASEVSAAYEQLRAVLGKRCVSLLHWTSPPALQSVPELAHLHILVKTRGYNSSTSTTSSSITDVNPAHMHLLLPPTASGVSAAAGMLCRPAVRHVLRVPHTLCANPPSPCSCHSTSKKRRARSLPYRNRVRLGRTCSGRSGGAIHLHSQGQAADRPIDRARAWTCAGACVYISVCLCIYMCVCSPCPPPNPPPSPPHRRLTH